MDCLLMRHGVAVEMEGWSGIDETRPLTNEGRTQVRLVAQGLSAMSVSPTHLISSPLCRAQETAELIRASLCPSVTMIVCDALKPDSSPEILTAFLQTIHASAVILCVGHEPLLGTTAGYWLTGHISHSYLMKRAGVGLIRMPSTPQIGEGLLRWWYTPAQLITLSHIDLTRSKGER
jgi:phosphohistidine phosphatase